ncbi:MAG: 50S ribosomal protein L19e [Desulfurococcaceae archaeon]|jgi:large subunit ribosomal protein L19e|nr:50S ribosomal protein L19e [Desulfurococcaceae archaeon]
MSDLTLQKRLAAEILGVGVSRIRIDPARVSDVAQAITREDVKKLIKNGAIWAEQEHGVAGYSSRIRSRQRVKGRSRGHGKREGGKYARSDPKRAWMSRIRKIRRYLRYLRNHGVLDRKTYRRIYMLAKGGYFSSLSSLRLYLKESGVLKET